MKELVSAVLEFKFNGEVCRMNFPTLGDSEKFEEAKKKEKNDSEAVIEFFTILGLEESVARKLQSHHVKYILEEFKKEKKN